MHHQRRTGRQQLHAEVTVGHAVQTVQRDLGEAQLRRLIFPVDGEGGARQGAAPDGGHVHALGGVVQAADIPLEHHGVGHEVVAEGDGLCPLQMGVAGHDGGLVLLRLPGDGLQQSQHQCADGGDLLPQIQPQIQRHLIVSGSGGVELLAHVAQPLRQHLLHEHVDILGAGVEGKLPLVQVGHDPGQAEDQRLGLLLGKDAAVGQHGGVSHGAGDILAVHAAVEVQGRVEVVRDLRRFLFGPSGPELCHGGAPFGGVVCGGGGVL